MNKLKTLLIFIVAILIISPLAAEPFWPDFFEMSQSMLEAESTALTSSDIGALKKAGVYFFSVANGFNAQKVERDRKLRELYAKKSMEYFNSAYELDPDNPAIATWMAAGTYSYGAASRKLRNRIKFGNTGIEYFEDVPAGERNNMDYLILRIILYSRIPPIFNDLTDIIRKDAKVYYAIYNSLETAEPRYRYFLESVKAMEARAYFKGKDANQDTARTILMTVDEQILLKGQADDTPTAKEYFEIKDKLLK